VLFTAERVTHGVRERTFSVADIPGVLWEPAGLTGRLPLVLLAHAGGQHKKSRTVAGCAHRLVLTCGLAVAALDAPGHGDRPKTEQEYEFGAGFHALKLAGEPLGAYVDRYNRELAARAVPDWPVALDALQKLDGIGPDGPVGFWGLSMGTVIGVLLAAAEPRISAAILGLAGHDGLTGPAAQVRVPLQFLLQWDDEMVTRESALTLFDAFGSREKTLHANPGGHLAVPGFEMASSERFFARHLGTARWQRA
jgi:dienelactone hydrolase